MLSQKFLAFEEKIVNGQWSNHTLYVSQVLLVTMASGGVRRIYEEDDPVDDSLLNQLSKWILYHRLPSLARDLGMSQAEFSRIATATTQPQEQIFKVRFASFLYFG